MGELLHFPNLKDTPEYRASRIQRLADLDAIIEPYQREAEDIRRELGLLAVEKGLEE